MYNIFFNIQKCLGNKIRRQSGGKISLARLMEKVFQLKNTAGFQEYAKVRRCFAVGFHGQVRRPI
jgi:hypothetical protein